MRDSVTTEIGDQATPSSAAVDAAESRVAEEHGRRNASEGAMLGSAAGRGRRMLWAFLSFLFVVGIAVSTIMMRSEWNAALDAVVEGARNEAQLATASFTGKQLTKPVRGSSYDKLAARLSKSVSSDGTIVGVTIWSSHGRMLFSLNESRVGKTSPEMRSLITGIAKGSASARVVDEKVQTFTPVSNATDGRVAVVQIDRPVAVVEAQTGDLWSTLRLVFGVGLAVSLLFLVLAFVRPRRLVRARGREERPGRDERQEGDVGAETNADRQPHEPRGPSYEEVFGAQLDVDDETVEQHGDLAGDPEALESDPEALGRVPESLDGDPDALGGDPEALEGDPEALKSIRQWDERYEGMVVEELKTQELMRRRREEFKARAEAAALRVKKQEAEPVEAPPTPD
jgi:hypothetical protein